MKSNLLRDLWSMRWAMLVCCVPGFAVASVVGASLLLALPVFGIDIGTPAFIGLAVMAVSCPLMKVVSVVVLRRQMACPMPFARGAAGVGKVVGTPTLAELERESQRLHDEIAALQPSPSQSPDLSGEH